MNAPQARTVLALVVGLVLGAAVVVALGTLTLYAFNPLADEYVCSEGEVPGGPAPVRPGQGNACYIPGELPKGFEADPLGNRPMSYNCDKAGYRLIEQEPAIGDGECIADETPIPSGWVVSDR